MSAVNPRTADRSAPELSFRKSHDGFGGWWVGETVRQRSSMERRYDQAPAGGARQSGGIFVTSLFGKRRTLSHCTIHKTGRDAGLAESGIALPIRH
jgi:hypothetical protein